MIHERPGERGALLLATGKFAGAVCEAFFQMDAPESFANSPRALRAIDFGQAQRQLDVFFERHPRKQIEGLKDHPHGFPPVSRQLTVAQKGLARNKAGSEAKSASFSDLL